MTTTDRTAGLGALARALLLLARPGRALLPPSGTLPRRCTRSASRSADGACRMRQAGPMRFATWNVNSVKARLPRLLDWLDATGPDVLVPAGDQGRRGRLPGRRGRRAGLRRPPRTARAGGTASRCSPGSASTTSAAGSPASPASPTRRPARSARICGGIRFISVYVPNGRTPEDPHYAYKLAWLAALRDVAGRRRGGRPAGGGRRLQRGAHRRRRVGPGGLRRVHPRHPAGAGRARRDARPRASPTSSARPLKGDHPFTYWDYRAGMFHQNKGMRIDLVYATAGRGRRGHGRGGRPRGPQGQGPLRPRPDRRRPRATDRRPHRPRSAARVRRVGWRDRICRRGATEGP